MIKKLKYGKTERYTFGNFVDKGDCPDLLSIQKDTYKQFLATGIKEVLDEFSPVVDYSGKGKLYFLSSSLDEQP